MACAVKFVRPYQGRSLFNVGEIAGFDADEAKNLIERGIAEKLEVPTEAKPVVTPAKTDKK